MGWIHDAPLGAKYHTPFWWDSPTLYARDHYNGMASQRRRKTRRCYNFAAINPCYRNLLNQSPPKIFLSAHISLFLIGLMWVLPFLQYRHADPIPNFYSEVLAFALGMAAMALLVFKRYWREMRLPQVSLVPLGLFAVLLLQLALGMAAYAETIMLAMLYLLWAVLLMLLAGVLRDALGMARVTRTLAWFLLAGGLLGAVIGVLQHFQISTFLDSVVDAKTGAAVFGNVAQPNHYADYISLALASLAYLWAAGAPGFANRRYGVAGAVLAALPLLFVLSVSGSRSAWLYLLALLLLAAAQYRHRHQRVAARRLMLISAAYLLGFALMQWLAVAAWIAVPGATITAADRLSEYVGGTTIRFYLWREAGLMFLQAPLLGVGWGQYAWHHFEWAAVLKQPEINGLYNNTHNVALQLLAETGVLGAGAVLGGIGWWLWGQRTEDRGQRTVKSAALRAVEKNREAVLTNLSSDFCPLSSDAHRWWIRALLAVMAIHSLLEYPLWYAYFLGIAAFLLGLSDYRFYRLPGKRFGNLVVAGVLVLGGVTAFSLTRQFYTLETSMFSRAARSVAPQNLPVYGLQHKIRAAYGHTLLMPYIELAYSPWLELSKNNLPAKIEFIKRAAHFSPVNTVVYQYAILLALAGEEAAALRQIEMAAASYPQELNGVAENLRIMIREYGAQAELAPLLAWIEAAQAAENKKQGAQ